MRVEGEIALEAHEQMLAVRVDRAHRAPGQALRPAVEAVTGLRGLDGDDLLSHERRADPASAP